MKTWYVLTFYYKWHISLSPKPKKVVFLYFQLYKLIPFPLSLFQCCCLNVRITTEFGLFHCDVKNCKFFLLICLWLPHTSQLALSTLRLSRLMNRKNLYKNSRSDNVGKFLFLSSLEHVNVCEIVWVSVDSTVVWGVRKNDVRCALM